MYKYIPKPMGQARKDIHLCFNSAVSPELFQNQATISQRIKSAYLEISFWDPGVVWKCGCVCERAFGIRFVDGYTFDLVSSIFQWVFPAFKDLTGNKVYTFCG
jgi:hypothetical protein